MGDQLRVQQDVSFYEIRTEGERVFRALQDNHPALYPLMPNYQRALELRREAQMNRDATVITVAISVFRHSQGVWPVSIDDALTSIEPKPLCRDYYGYDFVYRIVDDTPLLYAVGPNGIDNGGRGLRYESKSKARSEGAADDVLFLVPPGWSKDGLSGSDGTSSRKTGPVKNIGFGLQTARQTAVPSSLQVNYGAETEKALAHFNKLLIFWKNADTALPEVADARERVASL
jgi:hypothetical protein